MRNVSLHRRIIFLVGLALPLLAALVWFFWPRDYATLDADNMLAREASLHLLPDPERGHLIYLPPGSRVQVLDVRVVPHGAGTTLMAEVRTDDGTVGWVQMFYMTDSDYERLSKKYKPWTKRQ